MSSKTKQVDEDYERNSATSPVKQNTEVSSTTSVFTTVNAQNTYWKKHHSTNERTEMKLLHMLRCPEV